MSRSAFAGRLGVGVLALGISLLAGSAQPASALAAGLRAPVCRGTAVARPPSARRCVGPRRALDAGGLLSSPVGSLGTAAGGIGPAAGGIGQGVGGLASTAITGAVFSGLGAWVATGASFVLHQTADVLNETTTPRLGSTWFSATYWKVAGIAAVLTLPFLFAASVQALLRSDITLVVRACFGYLPLAMLAVAIAAPLTMLLLSASDELAAAVSSAAGGQGANFLAGAVASLGAVGGVSGSPFVAFLVGIFTVAGALFLWLELLIREAAVYVVVLMLPLAFAAFVWPARRIWAIRSIELLAALVLSKFAIVAVLSLGAAALGQSTHGGLAGLLAGVALLVLGAFAPWALLRLLPLAEVASSSAGALRGEAGVALRALRAADSRSAEASRWMSSTARLRDMAGATGPERPQPRTAEPQGRSAGDAAPEAPGESPVEAPREPAGSPREAAGSPTEPDTAAGLASEGGSPISKIGNIESFPPDPPDRGET